MLCTRFHSNVLILVENIKYCIVYNFLRQRVESIYLAGKLPLKWLSDWVYLCRQRHTSVLASAARKACKPCLPATSRWLSSATWNVFCSSTVAGPTCGCASFSSTSSTRTLRSRCATSGMRSSAASLLRSGLRLCYSVFNTAS